MEKKKILIIDDEALYIEMLKMRLEAEGYEVISASDGNDGLEKARKEKPDLILTDIMLTNINGFQVSRIIKSDKDTKDVKVIVCTSNLAAVNVVEARESMADEFIEKSSDCAVLLKTVRDFINEKFTI